PTTIFASRSFVARGTSGLSIMGPTTERCMLNESAVEPQPCASSSAASAPPLGRDVEPIEAGVAQGGVVLGGVSRVSIVLGRARGEVGSQTPRALLQLSLRRCDVKLHPKRS